MAGNRCCLRKPGSIDIIGPFLKGITAIPRLFKAIAKAAVITVFPAPPLRAAIIRRG